MELNMKKHGMSLMEVMIAVGLLAIISVPLYFVLSDSSKKANIAMARDHIKQEANKVFKILENDITQARKDTFTVSGDVLTMQVRKSQTKDMELKYSFSRPHLYRMLEGNRWLVSDQVDVFDISKSPEGNGKIIANLVMKSTMVGIKPSEQPTYDQQKLIIIVEDATEPNDPYWREVGDVSKFFATQGSIMAGLKEDASQLVQNFAAEWGEVLAELKDLENATIGQLRKAATDLKNSLGNVQGQIGKLNTEILKLNNEALYDRHFFGLFGLTSAEKRSAQRVRETLAGFENLNDFSWDKIKEHAQSDMKQEAIKGFFDAKKQLYESGQEIVKQMENVQGYADGEDFGFGEAFSQKSQWGL